MNPRPAIYTRWLVLPAALVAVVVAFIAPLLRAAWTCSPFASEALAAVDRDGWGLPFVRTWTLGAIGALLAVPLGYFGAVALRRATERTSIALGLLLIPVLVGETVAGFTLRLVLHEYTPRAIAERGFAATWALVLLARLWQTVPLNVALFLVRIQGLETSVREFAWTARLTTGELARDVLWPACRNLAVVLALFDVVDGVQEFGMTKILLQPSPGTHTELASHRLVRHYQENAMIDHELASGQTMALAAVYLLGSLVVAAVTVAAVMAVMHGLNLGARHVLRARSGGPRGPRRADAGLLCLALFVQVPFATWLLHLPDLQSFGALLDGDVMAAMLLTALAGGMGTALAIVFSFSTRIAFPHALATFDSRAAPTFVGILAIRLIPAVGLVLVAMTWLAGLHVRSDAAGRVAWLLTESFLAFPLLAVFLQCVHFDVETPEIEFHATARACGRELAGGSFFGRFRGEYFLAFVFACALIWNESELSSLLSASVPSVAVALAERVSGRAGSYREAVAWMLLTLGMPLPGLVAWSRRLRSGVADFERLT